MINPGRLVPCAVLVLAIATCAHKAAPLVKDRLKPRLLRIAPVNNRHVLFTFSEPLDTLNLVPENFVITDSTETLRVIFIFPALSASEIMVLTGPQKARVYQVTGKVTDPAENPLFFKKNFTGSENPDTIAPTLRSISRGKNNRDFKLSFSKAMDTTSLVYRVVPARGTVRRWLGLRRAEIVAATENDSLRRDSTYYLYGQEARDFAGNPLAHFFTSITPDSIYQPLVVKGRAVVDDTSRLLSGVAVLKRGRAIAVAPVRAGEFQFEVRDSARYFVQVIGDDYFGQDSITFGQDNIVVLRREKCAIDSFID